MKSKDFSKHLLVTILLVCCYQHTKAARMIKGSKNKNSTMANKLTNQANEKIREETEIEKTTTMTTTTTIKPELETTTLSTVFEVDGRHAFINNQFVAEGEEPLSTTSTNLQSNLQHSSYPNTMDYESEVPNIKESLNNNHEVSQKQLSKPLLGYDMAQFDDYEDQETSEYVSENDYLPDNCEDSQESMVDNNDKTIQTAYTQEQEMPDNDETIYGNKRYDSSYQKIPSDLGGPYNNNNFVPQTNINHGLLYDTKPAAKQQAQHSYGLIESNKKYHQTIPHDQYVVSKPLHHLDDTQQNSYVKTKPYDQRPHYNIAKIPQPLLSYQNALTKLNNKPEYSLYDKLDSSFMPNFSYSNSNVQTSSPFSSTSVHNKKIKTVSSSVQYVATPLADLVFKYSIGVAKHSNTKAAKNSLD